MMNLKLQIISILFSFVYGIIIHKTYIKIIKYLYQGKRIIRFINSFFYLIIITLIYFKIFCLINEGIINLYFLMITFFTFAILNHIHFTKKM